jgi:hypothetical protein
MTSDPIYIKLEKIRRDSKQTNYCFTCEGSGRVDKPISEWSEGEHEENACPRINSPKKTCPVCNGTGKIAVKHKNRTPGRLA